MSTIHPFYISVTPSNFSKRCSVFIQDLNDKKSVEISNIKSQIFIPRSDTRVKVNDMVTHDVYYFKKSELTPALEKLGFRDSAIHQLLIMDEVLKRQPQREFDFDSLPLQRKLLHYGVKNSRDYFFASQSMNALGLAPLSPDFPKERAWQYLKKQYRIEDDGELRDFIQAQEQHKLTQQKLETYRSCGITNFDEFWLVYPAAVARGIDLLELSPERVIDMIQEEICEQFNLLLEDIEDKKLGSKHKLFEKFENFIKREHKRKMEIYRSFKASEQSKNGQNVYKARECQQLEEHELNQFKIVQSLIKKAKAGNQESAELIIEETKKMCFDQKKMLLKLNEDYKKAKSLLKEIDNGNIDKLPNWIGLIDKIFKNKCAIIEDLSLRHKALQKDELRRIKAYWEPLIEAAKKNETVSIQKLIEEFKSKTFITPINSNKIIVYS
jgi:hypothetical protein